MNKNKFWELIDNIKEICKDDIRKMALELEERLNTYSVEEVQKFCGIYNTYHSALDKPGIVSIAYRMNHEMLTDDGFIDFRNWLIAQGKEVYMRTMQNPEILAEKAGETIDGWYEFEEFGYAGTKVIEHKTGDYRKAHVKLPEEEQAEILSEIRLGEFVNKIIDIDEMQMLFPKFTTKFIPKNECSKYDLEDINMEM